MNNNYRIKNTSNKSINLIGIMMKFNYKEIE
jgi:hypothetical protein